MSASEWTVERAADEIRHAEVSRTDRTPISDEWPELDVATAYRVQDLVINRRLEAGETMVGVKLGLTSRAKQQRMGVDSPVTGWLTDEMVLGVEIPLQVDELIHPRIEPEIVFVLGERLMGPGITAARAMGAVASVHAGAEVIDSRYKDFRFRITDTILDNASSAKFVVNPTGVSPVGLDLALQGCLLEVDGDVVDSATGAAVQGHPGEALALAANELGRRGIALEAGWIVLTGGMTDAVYAEPGHQVAAHFADLGSVCIACR
ncbi:2-keto-4-pentenoate hydratase [Tsukamurella spumae]|uniref:4-oxalocrotonate decarboxylase n=1 Tax=Tsukamurella spumae TaxID=44753 RepID=A0A846X2N2_9ACTN|nr:fumarylacetoacetate hydrolase family protein [Tsukamurella spumae]NKY19768.1 4-oxalocrotonate decarboxylase [Tsukamurella spumae]